jgi:hypothetical protein
MYATKSSSPQVSNEVIFRAVCSALISIPILSEKHRKDSMKLALAAKAHNLRN